MLYVSSDKLQWLLQWSVSRSPTRKTRKPQTVASFSANFAKDRDAATTQKYNLGGVSALRLKRVETSWNMVFSCVSHFMVQQRFPPDSPTWSHLDQPALRNMLQLIKLSPTYQNLES